MKLLLGNALWHLVSQSDSMTKLVLIGLLVASIVCWTLLFYKLLGLKQNYSQIKHFYHKVRSINNLQELTLFSEKHRYSYPGILLQEQLNNAYQLRKICSHKLFDAHQEQLLEEQRLSALDSMIHAQEQFTPILSVTATVAPLVGLFGTVWGLTHSLISMSEKQMADIVTTAPGIAEALLTTLAGLMVAIPAAVMYHYVRGFIDEIEFQLNKSSEKVQTIITLNLLAGKEDHELAITPTKATSQTVAS